MMYSMKLINVSSIVVITLLVSPAWSDVYKCSQPDGQVRYQQSPCQTSEGEKIQIPLRPSDKDDPITLIDKVNQDLKNIEKQREIELANWKKRYQEEAPTKCKGSNGGIHLGLDQDTFMLCKSFGLMIPSPKKINRTETAAGIEEQWIYEIKGISTDYYYFKNGILAAIQTQ